jgi:hypothetical protein
MAPLESSVMDVTSTTSTLKKLESKVTGAAAPKPKKNLWIEIKIGANSAEFDCLASEHAGSHKNRNVTFHANEDCVLQFSNVAVFGRDSIPLKAGKSETLPVADGTQAETEYAAYISGDPKIVVPNQMASLRDPKIVVP